MGLFRPVAGQLDLLYFSHTTDKIQLEHHDVDHAIKFQKICTGCSIVYTYLTMRNTIRASLDFTENVMGWSNVVVLPFSLPHDSVCLSVTVSDFFYDLFLWIDSLNDKRALLLKAIPQFRFSSILTHNKRCFT
jgi:hypothetical protein